MPVPSIIMGFMLTVVGISYCLVSLQANFIIIRGPMATHVVELHPALDELLQLAGDKAVIAVGAVVGADVQVGAGLPHLLLQDHDILGLKAADQVHLIAGLVQGLGHRQGDAQPSPPPRTATRP